MNHAEIEELLGVYTLDAVDPEEARIVEEHLARCPRCRAEVAAHREVAALLGNAGGEAPEGLWDRIAGELEAELGEAPPVPDVSAARLARFAPPARAAMGRPRSRRIRPVPLSLGAVAAALAVVVGLLSSKVASLDHQVRSITTTVTKTAVAQQSALALADPQHRSVELTSAIRHDSGPRAVIVILPGGQAYWVTEASLEKLPADETYQLWALADGRTVSLGLLGSSPKDVSVQTTSNMTKFMVTAEPLGGTTKPTSPIELQSS